MSGSQTGAGPTESSARTIAVTSGKGGVGKSSIATNLALALTLQGRRCCLFDADTNLANIDILLGIKPEHTLQQLISGEQSVERLLTTGPGGLQIVAAASGITEFIHLEAHQQRRLLNALTVLERRFDYLLIDTAAGVGETLLQLLMAAPALLVVITTEPTSLTDAFSLLKLLKRHHFDQPVYAVVNMAPQLADAHATFKRFRQAALKYLQVEVRYLGHIPADTHLPAAVKRQRPLLETAPESAAARSLTAIAGRLRTALRELPPRRFSDHFTVLESIPETVPPTPAELRQPPASADHRAAERAGLLTALRFAQQLAEADPPAPR